MASVTNKTIKIYTYIDELFSSGERLTVSELKDKVSDHFGRVISIAQIYRYLKDMVENFDAPIVNINVNGETRKMYEASRTMFLPSYIVKADNFRFIKVVKNLVKSLDGEPLEEAQTVLNELNAIYENTTANIQEANTNSFERIIFLGAPSAQISNEVYNTLYKAMEDNSQVRITYKKNEKSEPKEYGVCPYQLIYDNGTWDLWALHGKEKKKKFFNLCRISKVEIVKEKFVLEDNFDFRKATPGNFGCYIEQFEDPENKNNGYGLTHYKIRFRKGSYAANFVTERKWGKNDKYTVNDDSIDVEFDSNQGVLILKWVLGWGEDAIPLEPEQLVNDWKEKVSGMADNLKKMSI